MVMYSREQLADDFRKLGIRAADTVMLHASVRAVGEVAGGPDQIHLALKDALTAEGTLMMYASCARYYDEVGRGNLTDKQEREILEKLPAFDPLAARSDRDNGILVEFLRTYPGSLVNLHVARFVIWGKQAAHLMSSQPWNYALGMDSPLDRFVELNGKIVLLGSDHDAVTFLHYVEHVARRDDKTSTVVIRIARPHRRTVAERLRLAPRTIRRSFAAELVACASQQPSPRPPRLRGNRTHRRLKLFKFVQPQKWSVAHRGVDWNAVLRPASTRGTGSEAMGLLTQDLTSTTVCSRMKIQISLKARSAHP